MPETRLLLSEIRDTGAKRDHGDIAALVDSIREHGLLEPLVVDQDNRLIAGRRRFDALARLAAADAPVHQIKTASDSDRLAKSIAENICRKQLSWQEEVAATETLHQIMRAKKGAQPRGKHRAASSSPREDDGWSQQQTAKLLGESEPKVAEDLQLAQAVKERPELARHKEKTKARRELRAIKKAEARAADPAPEKPELAYSPEYLNVWDFNACDDRFGFPYPGRMPGQIVVNLLHLYTEPGSVVLDPFGGSGTTLDVCKAMGRECVICDIAPKRPDIAKRDVVAHGLPQGRAALVLLDPPYSQQKKGLYTDQATDLSNMAPDHFLVAMTRILSDAKALLAASGRIALILSADKAQGAVVDTPFLLYQKALGLGLRLEERINVPYQNATSITGYWIEYARKERQLLRAYRDLMIFADGDGQ